MTWAWAPTPWLVCALLGSVLGCKTAPAPEHAVQGADGGGAPSLADEDATWGASTAPVTIVWFGDFRCPFTARSSETMRQLESEYGPETLRIVWKSEPHPFDARGIELAEAGEVVRELGGSDAFWRFQQLAFAGQQDAGAGAYAEWARDARVDPGAFLEKLASRGGAEKVARDHALAGQLGVGGTPQFFVNGRLIKGAQPIETFDAAIRAELREATAK